MLCAHWENTFSWYIVCRIQKGKSLTNGVHRHPISLPFLLSVSYAEMMDKHTWKWRQNKERIKAHLTRIDKYYYTIGMDCSHMPHILWLEECFWIIHLKFVCLICRQTHKIILRINGYVLCTVYENSFFSIFFSCVQISKNIQHAQNIYTRALKKSADELLCKKCQ